MKNNLSITIIFAETPDWNGADINCIKDKIGAAYKTEDVLLLFGMGYHDFIITNKSKGTTYGRFKKHI